ncbi:orexin receptor type 2-like [Orbicella faveolata]|uniref:orexin receptor type 2-like n=1 Tax=Orbicella faveolata TaxID=48498 RepID=UPI0009E5679F|nr:orexin receptor type 2-like [Orbicella faveolata]
MNATVNSNPLEISTEFNHSVRICPSLSNELAFKILKYLIFIVIFVTSTCGNCFVCWVVWRRLRMRTVMNYYLVNLAVADLAFTLICIPFDLPVQEKACVWPYFVALCKALFPLQTMCVSASIFTLAAIGYSRYRAIVHPFKVQMGLAAAKKSILVIWIASFILVLPYVLVLKVNPSTGRCEEDWPEPKQIYSRLYSFVIFFIDYVIPLPIVFGSYLKICCELRQNEPNTPDGQGGNQARDSEKVLRMSIVITIVFALCALPNHIVWLVLDFNGSNCAQCNTWVILANIFIFANSAADPIVYTIFNEKYREEFRGLLGCRKLGARTQNGNIIDLNERAERVPL